MNYDTDALNIKLDSSQFTGFKLFYKSLPKKLATTIRFFDRSDFWTVHEADALFIGKEIFRSVTVIRNFGSGSEIVIINRANFEIVVKELLLVKQYRIEVYKAKSSSNQDWYLAYKASPGNLTQFEDLLYGSNEASTTSGLLAVKSAKVNERTVYGISYCDVATCRILVCEIVDDNHFGNLESVVVQLRPSECLVDCGSFQNVLERNRVAVTERKKNEFDAKDIVQDMNRLLKSKEDSQTNNFSNLPEANLPVALSCLAASIKYLELLADETNFGQYTLETFTTGLYVKLDGTASKSLNLLPSSQDGPGSFKSLYSVLNRCRTSMGQKLLSSWIHQPLLDVNQIEDRLDVVQVLIDDSELRKCLYEDLLRRVPDLQVSLRKLHSKKAGLAECYRIYKVVLLLPKFYEILASSVESLLDSQDQSEEVKRAQKFKELFCEPLKEIIVDLSKFKEMIETTVDLSRVDDNEYFIKPDFDEKLQGLCEQMDEIEEKIKKELNKAAKELGLDAGKTIKLESNSQHGFFFRITRKEEKFLRGKERSYKTIDANKAGVRFRSFPLESLNDRYVSIKDEFLEQQKGVVAEVVTVACGYVEPIQVLMNLISKVDVFVSLATASIDGPVPYVRPKVYKSENGKKQMKLMEVRHPCLERQDGICFIPNDVILSDKEKTFNIITGPNMGGKSTYVRSVGMVVLMAQMGCYVPCSSAEMTAVDAVLARVGASDNQMKGVSTFMAEMLETASILKTATDKSLVIVDELGRGTSTYDGLGLAWSIARHIATDIKSFCLFATHFHELTSLSDIVPCVGNLHVTAVISADSLTLLYKVKSGVCDQSFGIHVAELVQFPKHVIENAKKLAVEMEKSTSMLIGTYEHDDDDDDDYEPASKKVKSQIKLDDAKLFLGKVKELSKECSGTEDLWKKIQELKKSCDISF